eukprot:TRINITY_DN105494_c2_g1_i1.p4 TRINITY_DN105494_c2_g1~~TRINITY_DN105494_c2_g1_i1.p4  ORF type:complete len:229 (-),score=63.25 TRINITY_DN105494_c2_g1_i1:4393-5079(-)
MDKQIARADRDKKGYKYETSETKLANELECIEKTQKVLEKEVDFLKAKVETDTSYVRIDIFEKDYQASKKRNEETLKELKGKEKNIAKLDKQIRELRTKDAMDPLKEEELIIKLLQKENAKGIDLQRRIQQQMCGVSKKDTKGNELKQQIDELIGEIEALKREVKVSETPKEELQVEKKEESKKELDELQTQYDLEHKENCKKKAELNIEINAARGKLKELLYVIFWQ